MRFGAGCLWCQFGVINEAGARIAESGGVTVVMDRCLKVESTRATSAACTGSDSTRSGSPRCAAACSRGHMGRVTAVLFDVDGTLVDSNDAHAHAWVEALRRARLDVGSRACAADRHGRRQADARGDRHRRGAARGQRDRRRGAARSSASATCRRCAVPRARRAGRALQGATAYASSRRELGEAGRARAAAAHRRRRRPAGRGDISDDAERSKPDPDIVQAALRRGPARGRRRRDDRRHALRRRGGARAPASRRSRSAAAAGATPTWRAPRPSTTVPGIRWRSWTTHRCGADRRLPRSRLIGYALGLPVRHVLTSLIPLFVGPAVLLPIAAYAVLHRRVRAAGLVRAAARRHRALEHRPTPGS